MMNMHAANATSVVGNAIAIPPRVTAAATPTPTPAPPTPTPTAAAPTAAAPAPAPTADTVLMPMQMPTLNNPTAVSTAAAAAAAQLNLNHVRSAFKQPAVPPVAMPTATATAAAPQVPTVPNTAGANALQLSGRWSLDRDDSDSTNDYLEAMGLPLIARQAADKLDLMVIIHQTPGDFVITRRTRIFTETKTLKFGHEVVVKGNAIKVTGDPSMIKTITHLSNFRGVLTDIRTLDDRSRMHVELTLTLPDKPAVVIHRFFKKTSDSTTLENLPAFDMSLENTSDVKRKR